LLHPSDDEALADRAASSTMSRNDNDGDGRKIFIGGLPFEADDDMIRRDFGKFGDIEDIYLPKEPGSGKLRGFGFVTYRDERDANDASDEMTGREYHGRAITVNIAKPRTSDGGRGGGDRYGGGGYRDRGDDRGYSRRDNDRRDSYRDRDYDRRDRDDYDRRDRDRDRDYDRRDRRDDYDRRDRRDDSRDRGRDRRRDSPEDDRRRDSPGRDRDRRRDDDRRDDDRGDDDRGN